MTDYFWLIPLIPGVGAILNGLFGKRFSKPIITVIGVGSVVLAFLLAVVCFFGIFVGGEGAVEVGKHDPLFSWIPAMGVPMADGTYGTLNVAWEYRLDSLSMVMVLVVTGIGLLIHIYSVGYMAHDAGYWRFFTYLNMFTFFMLNLVMAANFLLMFIGWEGVGLCSYLLIGFWFERDAAASAGKKAFIVNRIGDAGFLLAIMFIFVNFGTLDFYKVMGAIGERFNAPQEGWGVLAVIGVLLFVGAAGKSAQIPLYVWLPDAMEGPTPVSALIHAATMVTAGVYMVARCAVLYQHAPAAMMVVAVIGAATALFAASIGLFQQDIKKVLAYSTVSQLGFMFLACGVGAFGAGIFHLMTHAFFKACLFLGSGSVIHTMEHAEHAAGGHRDYNAMQDMRNMGGLLKYMPKTGWTFIIATLALAGIFPFAGFFSKDEILWAASNHGHLGGLYTVLWLVAVIAAGMTTFYMTRQVCLTFFGEFRGGKEMESHLHESPNSMALPLVLLAVGSVFAGFVGIPFGLSHIGPFLEPAILAGGEVPEAAQPSVGLELVFMAISLAVALGAGFVAWKRYRHNPEGDKLVSDPWPGVYRTLSNKYYVDEIYDASVVDGTLGLASGFNTVDANVVDGVVNRAAKVTIETANMSNLTDENLVDGAVNLVADILGRFSTVFRRFQTGILQNYALLMLFGICMLVGFFYFWT